MSSGEVGCVETSGSQTGVTVALRETVWVVKVGRVGASAADEHPQCVGQSPRERVIWPGVSCAEVDSSWAWVPVVVVGRKPG